MTYVAVSEPLDHLLAKIIQMEENVPLEPTSWTASQLATFSVAPRRFGRHPENIYGGQAGSTANATCAAHFGAFHVLPNKDTDWHHQVSEGRLQ